MALKSVCVGREDGSGWKEVRFVALGFVGGSRVTGALRWVSPVAVSATGVAQPEEV